MKEYTDAQLMRGDYDKAAEYYDENAIILAIRNILLSKPGNFPFNPSIGMNIKQYQFEMLDDQTLQNIAIELKLQIGKYLPSIGNVETEVRAVQDDNGTNYLCIQVRAGMNNSQTTADFILKQRGDEVDVFNEII